METRIVKLEEFADEVRSRLGRIEAQLAVINVRLDGVATKAELAVVNARIDVLSERLEGMQAKFNERFDGLETKIARAIAEARNKTILWSVASFGVIQLLSNLSLQLF